MQWHRTIIKKPMGHIADQGNNNQNWSENLKTSFRVFNNKYLDNLKEFTIFNLFSTYS